MKRNLLFTLMAALMMTAFPSCDKGQDNNERGQHDPAADDDQTEITGYDGLEYFQNSIVVVDNAGNVVRRVCGKPFDESLPDVISIPVKDKKTAEEIFLGWIAPGKTYNKVDDGYDYELTDEAGKSQGKITFRDATEEGVLATVSAEEGTDLKMISKVNFVSEQIWDENDAVELYEAGNTYSRETTVFDWLFASYENDFLGTYNKKNKDFYCVQGNDNGKEAILVWLSPDTNMDEYHPTPSGYIKRELYKHLPTEPYARKVLDFYNENQDAWKEMLIYMDGKGYEWSPQSGGETTGNSEFLLNSYNKDTNRIKCLDLDGKTGEIINVRGWSWYKYRYIQILIFPPYILE